MRSFAACLRFEDHASASVPAVMEWVAQRPAWKRTSYAVIKSVLPPRLTSNSGSSPPFLSAFWNSETFFTD